MGSFNRHPTQAGRAFDAIIDIGAAKPIQQRAVIDTIASGTPFHWRIPEREWTLV